MRLPDVMNNVIDLQKTLYEAGARNFLFIDVPPIDRSPAGKYTRSPLQCVVCTTEFEPAVPVPASLPLPRYDRWNTALQSYADGFSSAYPEATTLLFSSHATFTRVLDDPVGHDFGAREVRRKKGEIWMDHLHPTSKMHGLVAKDLDSFLGIIHKFDNSKEALQTP